MLLTLDVGNTNTVFAVFKDGVLLHTWRLSTVAHRTADEYAIWLKHMFADVSLILENVSGAIISCVVPEAQYPLRKFCADCIHATPLIVGEEPLDLGIGVKTDNPAEVGADRLVNAAEAWHRYQKPLVVVDFGTATTFDIVNKNGDYVGGVIAPGVHLSIQALHRAAAKLPSIRVRRPEKVVGKNTITAMESGVYHGYMGMVDGIITAIRTELGYDLTVIATGGLATLYAEGSRDIEQAVDDLTISGLKTIFERNTKE
jgi:type III pantothenate kinase